MNPARQLVRGFPLLCAMAALLLLSVQHSAAQEANSARRPLAFVGASVIPLTDDETILRDHTVIVRDGRIAAIGPRRRVTVPADAIRIPAGGRYMIPSLADMHVHLEHFDDPVYLQLFLINGVAFVRNMDGRPFVLDWKRRASAGTLLSPHIYTAGPVLDGEPPVRSDNRVVRNGDEAQRAVEEQASEGYDFIKVYANLTTESFRAAMSAARGRGLPVAGHMPDAVPFEEVLGAGMVSFEHLGDFANNIRAGDPGPRRRWDAATRRLALRVDSAKMAALASQLAQTGVWIVPTMVLADRAVAAPEVLQRWMSDSAVAVIDRGILRYYWHGAVTRAAQALDAEGWLLVEPSRLNRLGLVSTFRQAGVPMLIGTDTPQPFTFPGASVHEELANFVAAGFSPMRALAAATRDAARFVGEGRLWGTVELGKRADLVLLAANPLQDISATRRIVGMMVGGQWLPGSRLQEMWRSVEKVAAASQ